MLKAFTSMAAHKPNTKEIAFIRETFNLKPLTSLPYIPKASIATKSQFFKKDFNSPTIFPYLLGFL